MSEKTVRMSGTRRLVMTALFAALTVAATAAVAIPLPAGGYLNLGDTVVLLGAYLLGGAYGAVAAGIGAAIADIMVGAALYAPATLVIKALMAVLAAAIYRALGRKNAALLLGGAAAEAVMVAGYWLFEACLMQGALGAAGAAVNIPGNLVQGVFGLAASTALTLALKKIPAVRREFPEF